MKVVIVGGGSAGWMTAAGLIKAFPNYDIRLIESPTIPRVGVGESTYDGIKYFIKYLDINTDNFFKKTDATLKIAIKFNNFYSDQYQESFIYPFGKPDISGTRWGLEDWQIKKALYPETPVSDFAESYFGAANLVKHNTFNENLDGSLGSFDTEFGTALHFNAIKFADFLKNEYCIPRGVKLISQNLVKTTLKNKNVSYLTLDNGEKIYADLFVDCTGFKSILIGQELKEKFISYNDVLPNNRAWATHIDYNDVEKELSFVTECTALNNGWSWHIPLWSNVGTGYVYSNKYISDDDALKEFKKYLENSPIIRKNKKYLDEIEYKNIDMRVGIYENVWSSNVVAIGLSAGFIEPLESNGLFTTHEFIFQLIKSLQRGIPSQWEKDAFNRSVKEIYDSFAEFIRMHYYLSKRSKSKYWNDIFNTKYDFSKKNGLGIESNHADDLIIYKNMRPSLPPFGGVPWIAAGMNYFHIDPVSTALGEMKNKMCYKKDLSENFSYLNQRRSQWDEVAKNSLSSYRYLKNKYYL